MFNFQISKLHTRGSLLWVSLLDVSKACSPDHITPKLLKLSDFINGTFSQLFNQSVSSGTLPRDCTTAITVPIHKKGERCLVKNYRPISLTSIVVKVMEKVICNQLVSVLDMTGHISDNKFGFHANCSTVTLLLSAIHDWGSCLEYRSATHYVFLDFAKALDSMPLEHLLLKLHYLKAITVASFFFNLLISESNYQQ